MLTTLSDEVLWFYVIDGRWAFWVNDAGERVIGDPHAQSSLSEYLELVRKHDAGYTGVD